MFALRNYLIIRFIAVITIVGFFVPMPLYAEAGANEDPANNLRVRNLQEGPGGLSALISLYASAATDAEVSARVGNPLARLTVRTRAPKLHLGILIDNAALCKNFNIEPAVAKLLSTLPTTLKQDSRVTVVAYNAHAFEVLGQGLLPKDASKLQFRCDPSAVSGSAQKAVERLLEEEASPLTDEKPVKVAWLFTSGNLRLPPATLSRLKRAQMPIDVFLYNKALASAMAPVAEEQRQALESGQYHFQAITSKEMEAPATYLQARILGQGEGKVQILFEATKGGQVVAFQSQSAHWPSQVSWFTWGWQAWSALSVLVLIIGAIVLLGRLAVSAIRRLRRQPCHRCGQFLKTGPELCSCQAKAALLGHWLCPDSPDLKQKKLAPIDCSTFDIGTHRRSQLPIVRPSGLRRAILAQIHRLEQAAGKVAFRITPLFPPGYGPVLLNGVPLTRARHLAHGDILTIREVTVSFVTVENSKGLA